MILKSQKDASKVISGMPVSASQSGQSFAIVSPSSSEASLNSNTNSILKNSEMNDMHECMKVNATFPSFVRSFNAAETVASTASSSIDSTALFHKISKENDVLNFNDDMFFRKTMFRTNVQKRFSLTTSFVPLLNDTQYHGECHESVKTQRFPSLALDEIEETMIKQDAWNDSLLPNDVFSNGNVGNLNQMSHSFGMNVDEDFMQLLRDLR
jgi:hypothetical protein